MNHLQGQGDHLDNRDEYAAALRYWITESEGEEAAIQRVREYYENLYSNTNCEESEEAP
jgi:hypothetical protein